MAGESALAGKSESSTSGVLSALGLGEELPLPLGLPLTLPLEAVGLLGDLGAAWTSVTCKMAVVKMKGGECMAMRQ